MSEHRGIYWTSGEARLRSFSASGRSKGISSIKFEIDVLDPAALGWMLRNLAEIQSAQEAETKPAKPKLLTCRGEP